jgi:hypothetical protein
MPQHRHQEFIRFLNTIERAVAPGRIIHAILDNYATHKHPKVRASLADHPPWVFHFTPTSASWLNAAEGFFSILTLPAPQARRLQVGQPVAGGHHPLHPRAQQAPQIFRLYKNRQSHPRQARSPACTFQMSRCISYSSLRKEIVSRVVV